MVRDRGADRVSGTRGRSSARLGVDYPFTVGVFARIETDLGVPVGVRVMGGGFSALLVSGAAIQLDLYAVPLVTDWGGRLYAGVHGGLEVIVSGFLFGSRTFAFLGGTLGYETPISSTAWFYVEVRPAVMIGLSNPGPPSFAPALGLGFNFLF